MAKKSPSIIKRILHYFLTPIILGVFGLVFAIIGALIGGKVLGSNAFGFGGPGLAVGGVVVGYPAGIIVGIIIIKKILRQRGSLLLGILGSILGVLITVVLSLLHLNFTNLLFWVFFLSVPLLCLAGFFLKR